MRSILSIMVLLLASSIFYQPALHAQTEGVSCGTTKAMQELYQARPDAAKKAREFDQFTEVFGDATAGQRTAASGYTIPVVFHVFGTDFLGASVSPTLIEEALQKTNDDFKGISVGYSDVSPLFSGIKATLDIEFALAKIDPNGNATSGITYNPVASGFGNGGGYDAQIQQYAWDNTKYMNIYIMLDLYGDGTTNNSGVAWYPDEWMTDNNLARVVYNGRYLGANTSENFRRVLTHEFGHFLNLAHTFDNGCAAPGDNVSDTPSTTSNSGTCNFSIEKCSGAGPANGENFMDYTECYRMFTQGQVARMTAALNHVARQSLWQPANLDATGVNGVGQHLLLSAASFREEQSNNGTVNAQASITAEDGATFATTGTLTEGVHYTTNNLPSGLNLGISVSNSTTASFTLSSSATNHAEANSVNDISITFLNPAITGGANSLFSPTLTFGISFIDPYQIVYEDLADITVNAAYTWEYFTISANDQAYGAWYSNGDLRMETYTKSMICEGTTRNLTKLNAGAAINASSNWVAGGAYPDEHDLRTSNYTVWDGQTGYVGFQAKNSQGWDIHGWFRLSVTASGNAFTVLDYAYNEDPNGTILAGQTTSGTGQVPVADFTASSTTIEEGQSVTYTDGSSQSPTSWNWTFAGGTPATSTNQNPQVTYSTAGVYAVTLQATNANGSHSVTKSGYITVNTPTTTSYCESSGNRVTYEWIAGVQVGSFNSTSGAQTYSDFTSQTVSLTRGQSHAITLTPGFSGSAYSEYFRVWIDYNQDGDFDDAGELAFDAGSASSTSVSGSITPASSAPLGNTRMRVSMKYGSAPSPCGNLGDGEVEDYTAVVTDGGTSTAPVANFTASSTAIVVGGTVAFTDQSTQAPTSWSWTFSGGSPATSTSQNPQVTYATAGTYAVSLTATNAQGSDTKTMSGYITVSAPVGYCTMTNGNPSGQYIQRVQLGAIDNSTTYDAGGYSDFTSMSTAATTGATLTVTPHTTWSGTGAKAWIDWNQDGDFDDANEEVLSGNGTGGSYSSTLSIPAGASSGSTRLRVRVTYGSTVSSCGDAYFSEVEDYTVSVSNGAAGPQSRTLVSGKAMVFPNPFRDIIQLDLTNFNEEEISITLFDLSGSIQFQQVISRNDRHLKIGNSLKDGFYVLQIQTDQLREVHRIVKSNE